MTLVVTDIERTETERLVSVSAPPMYPGGKPLHHGKETLLAARYLGVCSCGRPATARVWKLVNRYVPVKRQRQMTTVAAQAFQDDGVMVPTIGGVFVVCQDCGEQVKLSEVRGRVNETPCDARCTSARGLECKCQCGGAHHGEDWA